MKLKEITIAGTKINNVDSWREFSPPARSYHWKDGKSAKELARYITKDFPAIPKEMEALLLNFTDNATEFEWNGEHKTSLESHGLGSGGGRNHDMLLFDKNIVVGVESKSDETFDKKLSEIVTDPKISPNKKMRLDGLLTLIFGDTGEKHHSLRYQLLTGTVGTLLEAKERGISTALFLVLVFKKEGSYTPSKLEANRQDLELFLKMTGAEAVNDYYCIPTAYGKENGIKLYLKKIEINL